MELVKKARTGHTWLAPLENFINFLATLLFGGQGLAIKVDAVFAAALPAGTYSNGSSGVGATFTVTAHAALPAQDGYTPVLGSIILVVGQAAALQNGLYKVTTLGDGSNSAVLTRVTNFDQSAEMVNGTLFGVRNGTLYADTTWQYTAASAPTVGTTALTFAQVFPTIPAKHLTAWGLQLADGTVLGLGASQATSGVATVDVHHSLVMMTSTGAGQVITVPNGLRIGQLMLFQHTVDGGSVVVTPTNAGNFTAATLTAVHDWCMLSWNGATWDIVAYGGGATGATATIA